jgi:hypothetical protein
MVVEETVRSREWANVSLRAREKQTRERKETTKGWTRKGEWGNAQRSELSDGPADRARRYRKVMKASEQTLFDLLLAESRPLHASGAVFRIKARKKPTFD